MHCSVGGFRGLVVLICMFVGSGKKVSAGSRSTISGTPFSHVFFCAFSPLVGLGRLTALSMLEG